jgi:hypothetical protein
MRGAVSYGMRSEFGLHCRFISVLLASPTCHTLQRKRSLAPRRRRQSRRHSRSLLGIHTASDACNATQMATTAHDWLLFPKPLHHVCSIVFRAPQQPRRAEYLPPDWAVVRNRDGSRTYLGPVGERHRLEAPPAFRLFACFQCDVTTMQRMQWSLHEYKSLKVCMSLLCL